MLRKRLLWLLFRLSPRFRRWHRRRVLRALSRQADELGIYVE